jgi:hypothetical protein
MSETKDDVVPTPDSGAETTTRRHFVADLAKAAIVPAVLVSVAANSNPAFAR